MVTLFSKISPILASISRLFPIAWDAVRQAYTALVLRARSQLRLTWLAVLSVVLLSLIVLPHWGFLREDLQALVFPILFLGFWRLPRDRALRVPAPLMITALALWLGATLHVRGLTPVQDNSSSVIFARLGSDEQGLEARSMYQRYQQIARTYELLGGSLVHWGVDSNGNAATWLARSYPSSPFLVRGHPEWMEVVFNPKVQVLGFKQGETALVPMDWSDQSFAVGLLPSVIRVPGEPRELGLHFLAWLAQGLRPTFDGLNTSTTEGAAQGAALRRDALKQITDLDGVWLSNSPFGLGHFLLATYDLLEASEQRGGSEQLYSAALHDFRRAAAQVRIYDDPELYALIFNNAAVAQLASARVVSDYSQARHWFRLALDVVEVSESIPQGARLAYENLLKLERGVRITQ